MKKFMLLFFAMLMMGTSTLSAQNAAPQFADPKYTEIGKRGLAALSAGNVDAWMTDFADNARYIWNNGDSLVGKNAIMKYWKDRRSNSLQSIDFTNQIWLGVVTT